MQEALRVTDDRSTFNGLSLGKVYGVHSEANMVDVMLMNGTVLEKVQVLTSYGSSRGGGVSLPIPKYLDSTGKEISMLKRPNPMFPAKQGEIDIWVVVGYLGGYLLNAVVIGFLYPEECEVLCGRDSKGNKDGSMFLWKHDTSNIYVRIAEGDPNGTSPELEISHPSGLLIKVGGYDTDKDPDEQRTEITNWDSKNEIRTFNPLNPVTKKADPVPYIHLYHPSGTYFTVDDEGTVTVYGKKDVGITVEGDVTETINGDVTRTIKGNVTEEIDGTFDQTIKKKVTIGFQDEYDITVDKDTTETFKQKLTHEVDGDLDRTVQGKETDTVTGAWERDSSTSIKDKAPIIHHSNT